MTGFDAFFYATRRSGAHLAPGARIRYNGINLLQRGRFVFVGGSAQMNEQIVRGMAVGENEVRDVAQVLAANESIRAAAESFERPY